MLKAVGYVRVSKDEQADKNLSIPAQKASILTYCQSQNWNLIEIFVDDGYSGENLNRPHMQRLLNECRSGRFDIVIVWKLDRISRRQKDLLFLLEDIFEPRKIGFKSVTQAFDTTSSFGKAALGMLAVFAQLEREQLIERILAAKKQSAAQGRFLGGRPPYGYNCNHVKKSLEINEREAVVVRLIFGEYSKGGMGYQAIADLLNSLKIPASASAEWQRSTIAKMLANSAYAGFVKHKGVSYAGQHEPIISNDLWASVQSLMKKRNKYTPQIHAGLVSGIIYCGECGAKMRTKHVWQNHPSMPKKISRYYICYSQDKSAPYMMKTDFCDCGYKKSDLLDKDVLRQLFCLFPLEANSEAAGKAVAHLLQLHTPDNTLKLLKKELSQIQKILNKWYEAFEKDAISLDDLSERIRDLKIRKNILEEQIIMHEEQPGSASIKTASLDTMASMLLNFKFLWEIAAEEDRKLLIRNLIDKVIICKNNHIQIQPVFKK